MADRLSNALLHPSTAVQASGPGRGSLGTVLLLAQSFPPAEWVASIRSKNIAKYLSRLGWRVLVVTVDPRILLESRSQSEVRRLLASERIERVLTGYQWRVLMSGLVRPSGWVRPRVVGAVVRRVARWLDIDVGFGWVKPVLEACRHLRPGDVDVILATAPPFSAFDAASKLSERLSCPFVMDYRDPWNFPVFKWRPTKSATLRREEELLDKAGAVTVVSESLAEVFRRAFGLGNRVKVISNGFDPEDVDNVEPRRYPDDFAIVYAGSLHPPLSNLRPVLRAMRRLGERLDGERLLRLHYFGIHEHVVRRDAHAERADELLVCHGKVSQAQAFSAVKGADVVVVVSSTADRSDRIMKGVVTGKVFEALGMERPILLIAPRGSDAAKIVEGVGAGARFSGSETDGIEAFLEDAYHGRLKLRMGDVRCYSWPVMAGGMSRLLERVIDNRGWAAPGPGRSPRGGPRARRDPGGDLLERGMEDR